MSETDVGQLWEQLADVLNRLEEIGENVVPENEGDGEYRILGVSGSCIHWDIDTEEWIAIHPSEDG